MKDHESIVGTPFYLAPELWKSKRYAKESDIWALGVILYELCCLDRPFPATELEELKQKVLNDPIKKFPTEVTRELVALCKSMLQKDYTKRPDIEEIIFSEVF